MLELVGGAGLLALESRAHGVGPHIDDEVIERGKHLALVGEELVEGPRRDARGVENVLDDDGLEPLRGKALGRAAQDVHVAALESKALREAQQQIERRALGVVVLQGLHAGLHRPGKAQHLGPQVNDLTEDHRAAHLEFLEELLALGLAARRRLAALGFHALAARLAPAGNARGDAA